MATSTEQSQRLYCMRTKREAPQSVARSVCVARVCVCVCVCVCVWVDDYLSLTSPHVFFGHIDLKLWWLLIGKQENQCLISNWLKCNITDMSNRSQCVAHCDTVVSRVDFFLSLDSWHFLDFLALMKHRYCWLTSPLNGRTTDLHFLLIRLKKGLWVPVCRTWGGYIGSNWMYEGVCPLPQLFCGGTDGQTKHRLQKDAFFILLAATVGR